MGVHPTSNDHVQQSFFRQACIYSTHCSRSACHVDSCEVYSKVEYLGINCRIATVPLSTQPQAHWKQTKTTTILMISHDKNADQHLSQTDHSSFAWEASWTSDTSLPYTNVLSNLKLGATLAQPSETKLSQTNHAVSAWPFEQTLPDRRAESQSLQHHRRHLATGAVYAAGSP